MVPYSDAPDGQQGPLFQNVASEAACMAICENWKANHPNAQRGNDGKPIDKTKTGLVLKNSLHRCGVLPSCPALLA